MSIGAVFVNYSTEYNQQHITVRSQVMDKGRWWRFYFESLPYLENKHLISDDLSFVLRFTVQL